MERTNWAFYGPVALTFGRGAVRSLSEAVAKRRWTNVFVLTDQSLVDAGVVEQVVEPLKKAGCRTCVFDGGQPDAPVAAIRSAVEQLGDFRPDVILGLGGGSNMDMAKAAACLAVHGGSAQDYAGDQRVPGPIFPLILVPTTAGTGSEITAAAVLSDHERQTKFAILSNYLRPQLAVVDPELTLTCPARQTADSGIDALTHAIEAFLAIDNAHFPLPPGESTVYQGFTPYTDLFAQHAIGLIGNSLQRAVENGADLEAREQMCLAATSAGYAFSNSGVATVHALEYALAPIAKIPHGRGCGLLLPYVMQFNAPVHMQRMRRIGQLLGADVTERSDESAADAAVEAVCQLRNSIGIPNRLSDVGVSSHQLSEMAEVAAGVKRILRVSPRPVGAPELRTILESAF